MLSWTDALRLAGLAQLALALGSLSIPAVLGWRAHTAALPALTRQVFWTYALYIWSAHVAFGAVSLLCPELLVDGTPLARLVCGFIAAWWSLRLALQLAVMDRSARPPGRVFAVLELCLDALFVGLALTYTAAFLHAGAAR